MNEIDFKLLLKAALFSAQKHKHQRRRDANQTPYINHPLMVANILANEAGISDISVLCAALLHDTIEDTDTIYEQLLDLFGSEIADTVKEVTDDTSLPTPERKQKQVDNAAGKSSAAKLVKIADKTANLRDLLEIPPQNWNGERIMKYADWSKQVIAPMRGVNPKLETIFDQAFEKLQMR